MFSCYISRTPKQKTFHNFVKRLLLNTIFFSNSLKCHVPVLEYRTHTHIRFLCMILMVYGNLSLANLNFWICHLQQMITFRWKKNIKLALNSLNCLKVNIYWYMFFFTLSILIIFCSLIKIYFCFLYFKILLGAWGQFQTSWSHARVLDPS